LVGFSRLNSTHLCDSHRFLAKTTTTMGINERDNYWRSAYSFVEWWLLVITSFTKLASKLILSPFNPIRVYQSG
jgi:hypothetical protein